MLFVVIPRGKPKAAIGPYPCVVLVQDNWDDYGYRTTFSVLFYKTAGESISLGTVKILQSEQDGGYTELPRTFEQLPTTYCSLGTSLEYYECLVKLGRPVYTTYLRALRDVAFDDEVLARFEDLEGFKVSLLRSSGGARTISDAAKLLKGGALSSTPSRAGFKVKFKTQLAPETSSVTIDFDFRRKGLLPHRVNAVIGYNGAGKTCLLSNLAMVASGFGFATRAAILSDRAGRFVGAQPPFKAVVVISYSAFDSFALPESDLALSRIEDKGSIFGYSYCGLRDYAGGPADAENYRLKSQSQLSEAFAKALTRIAASDREDTLRECLRPFLDEPSFELIGLAPLLSTGGAIVTFGERPQYFNDLSSGHKIALLIVAQLVAHTNGEHPSLVLIDEPETHLHPPLLAAPLKSIRIGIEALNGYAIIATHSPVVLQEIPANYVRIIRRASTKTFVAHPIVETFGESIGIITESVFNLEEGRTDWRSTLRELAETKSLKEIDEMFDGKLGFVARSYVASVRED
ncbi:AAA family ATPase [Sphingosinicella sp.]|uniref:AAA family ATPase n=1 Tax=Sphingosinicella sp. TaxID=1917971 RepID=UPI00262605E6|nr:AAA family ATPase [Sphingosinicella sp.]